MERLLRNSPFLGIANTAHLINIAVPISAEKLFLYSHFVID
jgi:hypothetical protein